MNLFQQYDIAARRLQTAIFSASSAGGFETTEAEVKKLKAEAETAHAAWLASVQPLPETPPVLAGHGEEP